MFHFLYLDIFQILFPDELMEDDLDLLACLAEVSNDEEESNNEPCSPPSTSNSSNPPPITDIGDGVRKQSFHSPHPSSVHKRSSTGTVESNRTEQEESSFHTKSIKQNEETEAESKSIK